MKKQHLLKTMLLLCALVVGSNSLWAKTYQHVFNAKPSTGSGVTLSAVNWDISATNLGNYNSSNYAGVQIGTSSKTGSITLTSSSNWGEQNTTYDYYQYVKVTEVRIWLNTGGETVTPSVTIGGKAATSDGATVTKNSSAGSDWTKTTKVTFTPAVDGNTGIVVVNVSSTKAGYVCALEIDCEKVDKADPTASFEDASMNVGQRLNVSTLWDSNSPGAVTYSIKTGGSYASIDGTTLTATATGTVTLQAVQEATAAYNSITKTADITISAAKTLSSIAITTAPTKTSYQEFEKFDPTGMVVTATYSDATTRNVSEFSTYTPSGSLGVSDTNISVSYTENATTKTSSQAITVAAATAYATLPVSFDGKKADLPTGFTQTGLGSDYSSKPYLKFDHTGDNLILKIKHVPNELNFDVQGMTFSGGTFTLQVSDDGTTYTDHASYTSLGDKATKTITDLPATTHYIKWIYTEKSSGNVALGNIQLSGFSKNVTVSAANYATFSDNVDRDFTGSGIKVFSAKSNGSSVVLTEIEDGIVPANVGVVLYKDGGIADKPIYKINTNKTTLADNEMVANVSEGTVYKAGADSKTNYILSNEAAGVAFYVAAVGGATLAANRAYLSTSNNPGGGANFLGFDTETTGISGVAAQKASSNGVYYNLAGQKVQNPTKGLYIVNGKKVIIK